ncbi:sarcosine oxidase subunit gamma [Hyphomicrobium sp. 99]|uniref:sarcosine oxidase subunit gamma n=1 Tax=Hyphomicrobium sp. 99 TaxID=1163419 RepID=UPI0005F77CE8|nr:sarcosine oxidase subunit gamma family protein [Hyphomicrobium sp. 99]
MSELASHTNTARASDLIERNDVTVTHVAARRGASASLDEIARAAFGVSLPSSPKAVDAGGALIVWAGPDQWLIVQKDEAGVDRYAQLAKTFNGLASVVDVTDSRTIFRVSQSRPSEALLRSMGIDFHDDVFKPGDVAITHVSHLGVIVWRLPDGTAYDFACARTYSRDFADWLRKAKA